MNSLVRTDDFDYDLPSELIAQEPSAERAACRLMVIDRGTGAVAHRRFHELPGQLPAGSLLVLNDTRVFPARLEARKPTGGRVQVTLLRRLEGEEWEVLLLPARRVRPGQRLIFRESVLEAELVGGEGNTRRLRFHSRGDFMQWVWKHGRMPLPPYIEQTGEADERDRRRYQTVYAAAEGSVAAPTAGLHFTRELLDRIEHEFVTLHVGYGTFQPVWAEDVRQHRMQEEHFEVSEKAADRINRHRREGGKLVAVGTTTTRVLETLWSRHGEVRAGRGSTELFVYPGYRFGAVDALITNFHLPRSTLLMLVSAFAGRELILRCYEEAVKKSYRFYSYGDAMLIR